MMIFFVDVKAHFSGTHFGFYGGCHGNIMGFDVPK